MERRQRSLAPKPCNPASPLQGVYVPEMCVELTTRRVLVMEWVDGVRLRSAAAGAALPRGRDDLRLVEIGVHCSLEQARGPAQARLLQRGLPVAAVALLSYCAAAAPLEVSWEAIAACSVPCGGGQRRACLVLLHLLGASVHQSSRGPRARADAAGGLLPQRPAPGCGRARGRPARPAALQEPVKTYQHWGARVCSRGGSAILGCSVPCAAVPPQAPRVCVCV